MIWYRIIVGLWDSNLSERLQSQVLGCFSIKKPQKFGPMLIVRTAPMAKICHVKTFFQPFFKSYCELHLTLWNFFLDVRIKDAFLSRKHRNAGDAHFQNCLSGKNIKLKTTQPFFKRLYELHLIIIMKHLLESQNSLTRKFSKLFAVPQCNLMLTDNYRIWY